ncbi:MAG: bifunctional nuclease family protein [Myxococcota bacterium]|nr:bifunctional nuclease family protein [Myxococcota bacterium]
MPRLLLPIAITALLACGSDRSESPRDVAVQVGYVAVDKRAGAPVIVLQESDGRGRRLPIWIGFSEAHSIASEIERRDRPRPNTHDLAKRVIDRLDGSVERVIVTELRGGTFYAILVLRSNGELLEVDSRPSDAIALALRFGAPLFVRETLFDSAAELPTPAPEEEST